MNQFVLQHGRSAELRLFPHIMEVGIKKNGSIQLNTFLSTATEGLRMYCILEGRFEWRIGNQTYELLPGDSALILPDVSLGSENSVLDIGAFSWIHIAVQKQDSGGLQPGNWSGLADTEGAAIGNILSMSNRPVLTRFADAGKIIKCIYTELFGQEIGYQARVNHQLDELLIQVTRQMTRQHHSGRDFPKTFLHLEEILRRNLAHQWTVEEMAALVGLGTTLFNERVKSYSGFSPINYLINIRISEAIKLLKQPEISVTDIALDTGFYSSQHFSTTFRKLTGYKPSEFRKNHLRNQ